MKLGVIVASTRPGRVGFPVAEWFVGAAKAHGKFDVTLLDLKEIALPLFDEPKHPRLAQYEHEHTKRWSALVKAQDAFVVVTPEYNFMAPPALVNAFDFLYGEWHYKAIGFVSYGGIAAGARAVVHAKSMATTLKMMPMFEGVSLPFFTNQIKDGKFEPTPQNEQAATTMLDELLKWSGALKTLRA